MRIIPTMPGKDIETDPQPKWLRPIDPLVAAGLPIRIDPRLGVDDDTAYRLQRDAEPLLTVVTIFVTSNYDNVLAAEVIDDPENGSGRLPTTSDCSSPRAGRLMREHACSALDLSRLVGATLGCALAQTLSIGCGEP